MTLLQHSLGFVLGYLLVLSLSACDAKDSTVQPSNHAQSNTIANKRAAIDSSDQIATAHRPSNEDVKQTPLGTVIIRPSDDSTNTPGKIFLNGELIYTARREEVMPQFRGRPFNLGVIDWEENGKERPNYRITKMVVKEMSYTCQYIVLDFTGSKVWISELFPKDSGTQGCLDLTWVRWEKSRAFFYFGADESDWDKDGYHGWVEGYNPKLKAVFGPVDAPLPPKYCSLVPKPTNPYFREAGEPTCDDK